MIAVHSIRTDRFRLALQSYGGPAMITPMLNIMGLSAWTIRQQFDSFVLVTDDAGAEMARQCKLPYTDIVSVGESFDSHPCFWTHSKFKAYLQDRPFVHFDNDLFLWEPLPARLMEAPVFASHADTYMWGTYAEHIASLEQSIGLKGLHNKHFTNRMPVNMSMFGGNDTEAIGQFSSLVTDFVAGRNGFRDLDEDQQDRVMRGMHVFEQLWGSCFIQNELGIPITLALADDEILSNQPARDVKVTHLHGLKYAAQTQPNSEAAKLMYKVSSKLIDLAPEISLAIVDYGLDFGLLPSSERGLNNDSTVTNEPAHN